MCKKKRKTQKIEDRTIGKVKKNKPIYLRYTRQYYSTIFAIMRENVVKRKKKELRHCYPWNLGLERQSSQEKDDIIAGRAKRA